MGNCIFSIFTDSEARGIHGPSTWSKNGRQERTRIYRGTIARSRGSHWFAGRLQQRSQSSRCRIIWQYSSYVKQPFLIKLHAKETVAQKRQRNKAAHKRQRFKSFRHFFYKMVETMVTTYFFSLNCYFIYFIFQLGLLERNCESVLFLFSPFKLVN